MSQSLLDAPAARRTSYWPAVFTAGAHVVVAAAIAAVVIEPALIKQAVAMADFIEVELPPEPPAPEPPPAAPEPEPEVVQKRVVLAPTPKPVERAPEPPPEPTPAPPAAAQAAQVLAQNDVVDLSNSIVVGSGAKYGGGTTDSSGTSARAVRATGAKDVGGGVTPGGTPAPAPAVNRTRAPRLAGGASWSCPFPPEADVAGVNQAAVALRVSVGASGSVSAVQVTSEPGYGFGRAAKRCAMSKRWDPGLDASGRSVDATAVVNVRFVR
jgi:protein TonB